ncbi:hypothetical protein XELAEV_18029202mg [Xenopus laevis]|uniref:Uncharacterized protein n=1 Tax=Xenopus laevis TaxID=8355 RepID=A0A974CR25_XENLA|nr:hypothetical protein XELAEV_18029202mg [Xenopus laevis]
MKRGPSLGSILSPSLFKDIDVHSSTRWLTTKGCYRCGGTRCGTCRYMKPSKTFKGKHDSKSYNINFYANCGTNNIIYLVTLSYVQIIDRVTLGVRKGNTDLPLLKKEAMWIYRLGTVAPNGLNREWELNCFIDR